MSKFPKSIRSYHLAPPSALDALLKCLLAAAKSPRPIAADAAESELDAALYAVEPLPFAVEFGEVLCVVTPVALP